MEAYKELAAIFARLHCFGHLASIANWDMMTYMPQKGAGARGAALSELSVLSHNIITDPKVKTLLAQAKEGAASLSSIESANLREMERAWTKEGKLPEELVARQSKITTEAQAAWRVARPANDWDAFAPHLKAVVDVSIEQGKLLANGTDLSPYEALMDQFEPGMRVATVKAVFDDLKSWLPALIRQVMEKKKDVTYVEPKGPFPTDKQKELGMECMRTWKFDFDAGRLDVSAHPFCGGVPEDVRITTRYYDDVFDQSLMGIVHETGHAKYEQNRPQEYLAQPVSEARSMGIHESQSLFAEMQIGRSASFVEYLVPLIKKHLGEQDAFTGDNLKNLYRRVKPGFIRVDADELTYPLHVILRFEIEQALVAGELSVDDVPKVWNAKMKEYFGLEVGDNHKDGCLQDLHWSMGAIGYFPTYTLGAMYAAQFMTAMRRELTDAAVDEAIRTGNLEAILQWQKEKVWSHGSIFTTDELVKQATGEPLNTAHFRKHLEQRYLHDQN